MKIIRITALLALSFVFAALSSRAADTPASTLQHVNSEAHAARQAYVLVLPSTSKRVMNLMKNSLQVHLSKTMILVPSVGLRHASLHMSMSF